MLNQKMSFVSFASSQNVGFPFRFHNPPRTCLQTHVGIAPPSVETASSRHRCLSVTSPATTAIPPTSWSRSTLPDSSTTSWRVGDAVGDLPRWSQHPDDTDRLRRSRRTHLMSSLTASTLREYAMHARVDPLRALSPPRYKSLECFQQATSVRMSWPILL